MVFVLGTDFGTGNDGQAGLQAGALGLGSLGDEGLEAAHGDGDGSGQVGALGGLGGLGDGDALNLSQGLAGDVGSEAGSLLIPLSNGTAPGHHAVLLTQQILGGENAVSAGSDGAVGIEADLALDGIQDTGSDHVTVHGDGGGVHIQLCGAGILAFGRLGVSQRSHDGQLQGIAGLSAQVLSGGNGHFDGGNVAAQVDGSGGGQIGIGSIAVLVNGTIVQINGILTDDILCQGSGLLVPLILGTAIELHVVVVAQLVLGQNLSGNIGSDDTVSAELDRSADGIDDAVTDDAVIVNQNGNDGRIVLGFAVHTVGSGSDDGQTGLQRTLGNHRCLGGFGVGGLFRFTLGGAGAVRIVDHGGSRTAGQQTGHQDQRKNLGYFFHGIYLLFTNYHYIVA